MPTGYAGRETSHNSGPFYEKIQKAFHRGGVHAATNRKIPLHEDFLMSET
jgi:hypothetical protein